MKKLICMMSFLLLSCASFASSSMDIETFYKTGFLKPGTKIGKCEVITSKLLQAYGNGPVSGMQIEVQLDNKIVMALLVSKLSVGQNLIGSNLVITSAFESTTGGDSPLSGVFEKRTSQQVRIKTKSNTEGPGSVYDLMIETKQENFFGNMKVVSEKSLSCN